MSIQARAFGYALLVTFLTFLGARSASAWEPAGHALIGRITDQLLIGTKAGAQVDALLGGTYSLENAAKWADCIKSVHRDTSGNFRYVKDQYTKPCGAFETPVETQFMEDFVSRNWDRFEHRPNKGDHEEFHFADIPIQHKLYSPSDIGANDHDVVHAINAAIAKLRNPAAPLPQPFSIANEKEAILLIAHLIGDLHQPLHVGSIYLDANGRRLTPKDAAEAKASSTIGGNAIAVDSGNLHHEWDDTPRKLERASLMALVREARAVVINSNTSTEDWMTTWASESVAAANEAYKGVTFAPMEPHKWKASFVDRKKYVAAVEKEQRLRVVQAGARLAAVFQAIWPG